MHLFFHRASARKTNENKLGVCLELSKMLTRDRAGNSSRAWIYAVARSRIPKRIFVRSRVTGIIIEIASPFSAKLEYSETIFFSSNNYYEKNIVAISAKNPTKCYPHVIRKRVEN